MPQYTTISALKINLPTIPPENLDGTQYTSAEWDAILTGILGKKSQYIDDNVGSNYAFSYKSNTQKFPDITDSPSTPATIEDICINLSVARALRYYGAAYDAEDNSVIKQYLSDANEMLKNIRDGKTKITVGGSNLSNIGVTTQNDYATGQTEPIFNPDELAKY